MSPSQLQSFGKVRHLIEGGTYSRVVLMIGFTVIGTLSKLMWWPTANLHSRGFQAKQILLALDINHSQLNGDLPADCLLFAAASL